MKVWYEAGLPAHMCYSNEQPNTFFSLYKKCRINTCCRLIEIERFLTQLWKPGFDAYKLCFDKAYDALKQNTNKKCH